MKPFLSSLICILFTSQISAVLGDNRDAELTNYQAARRGLERMQISGHLSGEKMLNICIPDSRRQLGAFTEYEFDLLPGFHGLTIIAKNGLLKRATEWSCTYTRVYFDELAAEDEKHYQQLCVANVDVPHEQVIGRWGWSRPPMRQWSRKGAED